MTLRNVSVFALVFSATALAGGCHSPRANISTTQDEKYPLNRQSKIAFQNEAQAPSLEGKIAGDFARERLHAMGYPIVPFADADYLMRANQTARNYEVADLPKEPSPDVTVGRDNNTDSLSDLGIPLGPAQDITVRRTELDLTLETTQIPPVVIWQGKILAESTDVAEYRREFFDALLSRLGLTFKGSVRLDKPEEVTPSPAAASTAK